MATRRPSRAVQIGAALAAFGLLAGLLAGVFAVAGGNNTATSTTSSTTSTTVVLSAEQYRQRAAVASQLVADAAGERCALAIAYTDVQSLPAPVDADQMRALIDVTVELLRASAVSAAEDQPEVSAQIAATADALESEAMAAGYAPDWLTEAGDDTALADPAFTEAFAQYQEQTFEACFAEESDPGG